MSGCKMLTVIVFASVMVLCGTVPAPNTGTAASPPPLDPSILADPFHDPAKFHYHPYDLPPPSHMVYDTTPGPHQAGPAPAGTQQQPGGSQQQPNTNTNTNVAVANNPDPNFNQYHYNSQPAQYHYDAYQNQNQPNSQQNQYYYNSQPAPNQPNSQQNQYHYNSQPAQYQYNSDPNQHQYNHYPNQNQYNNYPNPNQYNNYPNQHQYNHYPNQPTSSPNQYPTTTLAPAPYQPAAPAAAAAQNPSGAEEYEAEDGRMPNTARPSGPSYGSQLSANPPPQYHWYYGNYGLSNVQQRQQQPAQSNPLNLPLLYLAMSSW